MDSPDLLDQPREIGRRIGAACGYSEKKQGEIADELGRDERTLRSYIRGNLGDYSTRELRRVLIERVEQITGCPPEIFGLSEPEQGEVDQLRREFEDELNAVKVELLGEIEKVRRAQASAPSSQERGAQG